MSFPAASRSVLVDEGILATLLHAWDPNREHEDICNSVYTAVVYLSESPQLARRIFAGKDGIELTSALCQGVEQDCGACAAVGVLHNFAVPAASREELCDLGGMRAVLELLQDKHYQASADIAATACETLEYLAYNAQVCEIVQSGKYSYRYDGLWKTIIDVLDTHSRVATVMDSACRTLFNLTLDHAGNRATLRQLNIMDKLNSLRAPRSQENSIAPRSAAVARRVRCWPNRKNQETSTGGEALAARARMHVCSQA